MPVKFTTNNTFLILNILANLINVHAFNGLIEL